MALQVGGGECSVPLSRARALQIYI